MEIWKTIKSHPNYQVSRHGEIMNIDTGKFLCISRPPNRYPKALNKQLHLLIWETFNGEIPKGFVINHKNLDKTDSSLDNLEMITPQKNAIHWIERWGRKKGDVLPLCQWCGQFYLRNRYRDLCFHHHCKKMTEAERNKKSEYDLKNQKWNIKKRGKS